MSTRIPWTAGRWAEVGHCACGATVYPDRFTAIAHLGTIMAYHGLMPVSAKTTSISA